MKILHVFKSFYPDTRGGIEECISQLCTYHSRQYGDDCTLITTSKLDAAERYDEDGFKVIRCYQNIDVASTPVSYEFFKRFSLAVANSDIVNFHFPWPMADLAWLIGNCDKPYVVTYHSDIVRQKVSNFLYSFIRRRFLGGAAAIVATSPNYVDTSAVLQRHMEKVVVIPLGIDPLPYEVTDTKRLKCWRDTVGEGFFLYIGVLRYYKGLDVLLDAAKRTTATIVIAGGGPLGAHVQTRVEEEGIRNVKLVGFVDDVDKFCLLALSGCVVLPSHSRTEAFGICLLEGMLNGKPLITAEIGSGTTYVNLDRQTGLVFKPGDSRELAKYINLLRENDALRERYGAAAKQRFHQKFLGISMAQQYRDLYVKVLESNSGEVR